VRGGSFDKFLVGGEKTMKNMLVIQDHDPTSKLENQPCLKPAANIFTTPLITILLAKKKVSSVSMIFP